MVVPPSGCTWWSRSSRRSDPLRETFSGPERSEAGPFGRAVSMEKAPVCRGKSSGPKASRGHHAIQPPNGICSLPQPPWGGADRRTVPARGVSHRKHIPKPETRNQHAEDGRGGNKTTGWKASAVQGHEQRYGASDVRAAVPLLAKLESGVLHSQSRPTAVHRTRLYSGCRRPQLCMAGGFFLTRRQI